MSDEEAKLSPLTLAMIEQEKRDQEARYRISKTWWAQRGFDLWLESVVKLSPLPLPLIESGFSYRFINTWPDTLMVKEGIAPDSVWPVPATPTVKEEIATPEKKTSWIDLWLEWDENFIKVAREKLKDRAEQWLMDWHNDTNKCDTPIIVKDSNASQTNEETSDSQSS